MQLKAEFANGSCRLVLLTEDEWERKLLGAVAKGGNLSATVEYETEGYFPHQLGKAVRILLDAAPAHANL